MASKAPSYGCHGEPGTVAVPEKGVVVRERERENEKEEEEEGKKSKASGCTSGGVGVQTAAVVSAHQQTMTQPPGGRVERANDAWDRIHMRRKYSNSDNSDSNENNSTDNNNWL